MPMSSPMMTRMLGFSCAEADTGPSVIEANTAAAPNSIFCDAFTFTLPINFAALRWQASGAITIENTIVKGDKLLARKVCKIAHHRNVCAASALPQVPTFAGARGMAAYVRRVLYVNIRFYWSGPALELDMLYDRRRRWGLIDNS